MKNYEIKDASTKDASNKKYSNLPTMLDWTSPSKAHYEGITQNQEWIHTKEGGDYAWCIVGDTLYFDIQCTTTESDWHDNLYYYQEYVRDDQLTSFRGSKFKVHSGFYKQYLSYRNVFLDLCYREDVKKIYISGYSLGAAETCIAVQDAVFHFAEFDLKGNIIKTTKEIFGIGYDGARAFSPNKKLKQYFDGHFIMTKMHWDPVVHCPPKISILPFIRFSIYPFKIWFVKSLNFIRYKDYGKIIWIGKWNSCKPCKHLPSEIGKGLYDKFGK